MRLQEILVALAVLAGVGCTTDPLNGTAFPVQRLIIKGAARRRAHPPARRMYIFPFLGWRFDWNRAPWRRWVARALARNRGWQAANYAKSQVDNHAQSRCSGRDRCQLDSSGSRRRIGRSACRQPPDDS